MNLGEVCEKIKPNPTESFIPPMRTKFDFKYIVLSILLICLYVIASKLGLIHTVFDNTSAVSPDSGLAVIVLAILGIHYWPVILIGSFLSHLSLSTPALVSLGIGLGSLAESFMAYSLIKRTYNVKGKPVPQRRPVAFILAGLTAPLLSASIAIISLKLGGLLKHVSWENAWTTWWIGNSLGILIIAPLLYPAQYSIKLKKSSVERFFISLALVVLTYILLLSSKNFINLIVFYPFLLLLNLRMSSRELKLATLFICVMAITGTYFKEGPFSNGLIEHEIIRLQLFMASISLSSLTLISFKSSGPLKTPNITLLLCWFITGMIILSFQNNEQREQDLKFTNYIQKASDSIKERYGVYENALQGAVGFLESSKNVTPTEWKSYIEAIDILNKYPGILGAGVILSVPYKESHNYEQLQKRNGLSNFRIKDIPNHNFNIYQNRNLNRYVITYLEPASLETGIGYDVGSEKLRREISEQAIESGKTIITPKISLYSTPEDDMGFMVMAPFYNKKGTNRRGSFKGFIFAPFYYEVFIKAALADYLRELTVVVFDGPMSKSTVVFESEVNFLNKNDDHLKFTNINMGQKHFTLAWRIRNHSSLPVSTFVSWISWMGSVLSLLIASLVVGFENIYRKAEDIADEKTQLLTESESKIKILNKDLENRISLRTLALENAYKEIKESEIRFRELADSMPQIVWRTNTEGRPEYYNKRWYDYSGYTIDDFELLNTESIIHPDDRIIINSKWTQSLEDKSSVEALLRLWDYRNSFYRWHLTRIVPIFDGQGNVRNWYGTSTDIHEQKILEIEQQKFISLVENNPDTIAMFDFDRSIIYMNEAGKSSLGMNEELDYLIEEFFFDQNEFRQKVFLTVIETGSWEGEIELFNRRDEFNIITLTHIYIIRNSLTNDPLSIAMVSRDITEIKSAEIERVYFKGREQAAIESSKLKSEFLANMSHEIRTPINGILGMTSLLSMTHLDPAQSDMIDSLKNAGDTLLTVINDILDLSKIEAGKLDFENINFDLAQLLESTVQSFGHDSITKKIPVRLEISHNIPQILKGDPFRIKQVLTNLISNAFKFSSQGEIYIKGELKVHNEQNVRLRFSVSDSGIGISEGNQENLFKPFTQADSSTSRQFGGSGLGLSICKHLVERMNGVIGVLSSENQGSTFWFEIELSQSSDELLTEVNISKNNLKFTGLKILVAEDNVINTKVFSNMLHTLGATISLAANGEEAFQMAESDDYDLILMDCQMPIIDGHESTKRIRASHKIHNQTVPIIAVTANALRGEKEKCLRSGMSDYLSKPISIDDLSHMIERWLPIKTSKAYVSSIQKISPPLFQELVEIYLKTTPAILESINVAFNEKDYVKFSFELHTFKSGCLNMELNILGKICLKLETALSLGQYDKLGPLIKELNSEVEKSYHHLIT